MGRKSRSSKPRTRPARPSQRSVHPNAAAIDVGATHAFAALPPDRDAEPVQVFETFTEDLHRLARWLQAHRITTVAMESTGVFWIPIFQILEAYGIEVFLVNAQHVKNVPGRKTDVLDCQWLQHLHEVGLLRGSFRPPDEICAVRTLLRHRAMLVSQGAMHIQHMQKALTQMNLHLHHVLSDLSGVSGLAIVDAILQGERDPERLAALRDPRVKASEETVRKALVGDWRPEHLFTLGQARDAYRYCREQMSACDAEIERLLHTLASHPDATDTPPPPQAGHRARKGEIELPHTDLREECYRLLGVDATTVPGLGSSTVCSLIGELGTNLGGSFPTGGHFSSWMAVCPHPKISGGRVLKRGTRDVKHRVATMFRLAAQTLARSSCALGAFYRRMRAKLGAPKAITATAHKLARIYYHVVTTGQPYDESVFAQYEELHQKRRLARIKREAADFGMLLVPEGTGP
jgi:transposase